MERKQFLKCGVGDSVTLKVAKISKQDVVNVESEEAIFPIYSQFLKDKLRTLYQADKGNPNGALVGKTLKFSRTIKGYDVSLVSSHDNFGEDAEEADEPF